MAHIGQTMLPVSPILIARTRGRSNEELAARIAAARAEARVDAALVRRFNDGDEAAFNEIVRRHRKRMFRVVRGCLRNRADVEEVVDDAFMRAYRGLPNFRGESSLATWLHHIAMNLARNRYWFLFRRRQLAPSLDAPVSGTAHATLVDFVASGSPDPAHKLDQEDFAALVIACLDRLPRRQRDILKLRALLDTSYQAIALELGIKEGTVKSRIARARQSLRIQMDAMIAEEPRPRSSF